VYYHFKYLKHLSPKGLEQPTTCTRGWFQRNLIEKGKVFIIRYIDLTVFSIVLCAQSFFLKCV